MSEIILTISLDSYSCSYYRLIETDIFDDMVAFNVTTGLGITVRTVIGAITENKSYFQMIFSQQ